MRSSSPCQGSLERRLEAAVDSELWRGIGLALVIQLVLMFGWWTAAHRGRTAGAARVGGSWREPRALATRSLVVAGLCIAAAAVTLGLLGVAWPVLFAVIALGLAALAFASREGRAEAKRFLALIDTAPLGIVACDATGRLTVVNAQVWRMLGAPSGIPIERLGNLLEHPRVLENGALEIVHRALAAGETFATEASYESQWRGLRKFRVVGGPLRGDDGGIEGALFLLEDVTERAAIQRYVRETRHLDAMSRLAAGIAQEVKDPLSVVRSNLTAMREELPQLAGGENFTSSNQLLEFARILDESAEGVERAIELMGDLRGLALTEADDGTELETTSLTALLRSCVRVAAARKKSGLLIDEHYAELPSVQGAPSQLRHVFLPLLVSAVDAAGERGRVRVRTTPEPGYAVVHVSDDGPGIAPERRSRMFEPSFAAKSPEDTAGLELFIAREIVHAHRGEIRLHSRPGAGATFEVRLPLETPDEPPPG